jgi:hypothetical protein
MRHLSFGLDPLRKKKEKKEPLKKAQHDKIEKVACLV